MQRLVDRAIEEFLRDTYGESLWAEVTAREALGITAAADTGLRNHPAICLWATRLDRPAEELFEDLGAWLARCEPIRRLLRFTGREFAEFVIRLEELPGRAHMVMPDLAMPVVNIASTGIGDLRVTLPEKERGWTALLAGMLRAMADDYGALGVILVEGNQIEVQISDGEFAEARDFQLGAVYRIREAG